MIIRWLDMNLVDWKPDMLDKLEKLLDSELKYADERKGVACRSIDFQQEAGYPKDEGRFLDTSISGLCTDEEGKVHNIPKEMLTVAIERHIDEVNNLIGHRVYTVGHVQFYTHTRNLLNLIIIPISIGIIVLLFVLTFVLRAIRNKQKRKHILTELGKKKKSTDSKGQTVANPDPHANEKQRLLQIDPSVVGSASNTLGSPKEFTNEQSPTRSTPSSTGRYENQPRFTNLQTQSPSEMIPMHEQQPRVIVRTIKEGEPSTTNYNDQYPDPSMRFVPIPVQVERSAGSQQRYTAPPYHSDPYYRQNNA